MGIQAIKPTLIKPERIPTPQCSIVVDDPSHWKGWRSQRYERLRPQFDPKLCQHESSFKIDGKYYCRAHAGQITLKMWCDGLLVSSATEDPSHG